MAEKRLTSSEICHVPGIFSELSGDSALAPSEKTRTLRRFVHVAATQTAFLNRKESTNMDINGLIEPFQQFADHLQGFPEQAQPAAEQPAQGTEGLESQQPATDGAENAPGSAPEAPQGEAPSEVPQGEAPADAPQAEAPADAPGEAPASENGENAASAESLLDSISSSL